MVGECPLAPCIAAAVEADSSLDGDEFRHYDRGMEHRGRLMKNIVKQPFALTAMLFLCAALRAQDKCPVEVKFLLSSPAPETAIASLGFERQTTGRVYFFDSDSLDLLAQGVVVRVRQGANNDLTLKVRQPKGKQGDDNSQLHGRFPCEIDRTPGGAIVTYAVQRRYKTDKVPTIGSEVHDLLSASQTQLLRESRVSIDWASVKRIADIRLTKWETPVASPSGKLALELWEWPAGKLLEVSAKASDVAAESKYAELEQLLKGKDLSLNAEQDTKTSVALKTLAHRR
jgi:hypothetical protein